MNPKQARNPQVFKLITQINKTDLMIGRLETRVEGLNRDIKRMTFGADFERMRKRLFKKAGREI